MKSLEFLNIYRAPLQGNMGDHENGLFIIPFNGCNLQVIASTGGHWDHVSVSLPNKCPTWEDMNYIKDMFFEADECVMQLHPQKSNYVNLHKYCLHLWRPQRDTIPMPPIYMV